ncbi:hypothetical protein C5167_005787 [Papaver somniferum]|uniref:Uncharacterized protein n=1 Tax=Papaver somniferum TaxID=3469 RepID=A0A4Y7JEY5_PAPSO|nr:hypothetical protein C5167_005787 [Papaver somniferum]
MEERDNSPLLDLNVIAKGGVLVVTKFVEEHNHELVLAEEAHLLSVRYSDLAHIALTVAMNGSVDEGSSSIVKRHLASCAEELNAYRISLETTAQVDDSENHEQQGKVKNNGRRNIEGELITIQDPPIKKKVRGEQNTGCNKELYRHIYALVGPKPEAGRSSFSI